MTECPECFINITSDERPRRRKKWIWTEEDIEKKKIKQKAYYEKHTFDTGN